MKPSLGHLRFSPSASLPPTSWRWFAPVPAACLLFSVYGLCFANGVYVGLIDNCIMTKSIGVSLFSASIGFTVCGVVLHTASSDDVYRTGPRTLASICAGLISCQALIPRVLPMGHAIPVYVAAAFYGLGCGCNYMIGLAVLQAWVPERPGAVTALGMLCIPIGSSLGVVWYRTAAELLGGPLPAMTSTGLSCALITLLSGIFAIRPTRGWDPRYNGDSIEEGEGSAAQVPTSKPDLPRGLRQCSDLFEKNYGVTRSTEKTPLIKQLTDVENCAIEQEKTAAYGDVQMTLGEMVRSPPVYPFMVGLTSLMVPGSGFVIAYPHMLSLSFGLQIPTANRWLIWVHAAGILGRVLGGTAIDHMGGRKPGSAGFPGTRTVFRALVFLQTLAILTMPFSIRLGFPLLFTISAGAVYFCLSAGAVAAACLARSIFTPLNSSLAFSAMGGILGVMDLLQFEIISRSTVGNAAEVIAGAQPHAFDAFIFMVLGLTLCGLISSFFLKLERIAYRKANILIPEDSDDL